jgi:hypothetical protein
MWLTTLKQLRLAAGGFLSRSLHELSLLRLLLSGTTAIPFVAVETKSADLCHALKVL